MPDISVIIVNYNTADLVSECITSVLKQQSVSLEVIIVDNASTDNSISIIEKNFPEVSLIKNKDNLGFGKANNQASKLAHGRYLYLLNPDAELTNKKDLKNLLTYMEDHPKIGLAGTPLINNENINEGEPKYYYPDEQHLSIALPQLPGEIAWVIGASMMIESMAYQQVSGFDEDYFLYGEEADLCLRMRKAGFTIGYYQNVRISHLGGGSERKTDPYSLTLKKQRALQLFYRKHYEPKDIARLKKKQLNRAQVRYRINQVLFLITRKEKYLRKQQHYLAIIESNKTD